MTNILLLTLLDGIIFGFGFAIGICTLITISDFIRSIYTKKIKQEPRDDDPSRNSY